MDRLGYTLYVAQGGDVGAYVTDAMGRQAPEGRSASTSTCSPRRSLSRTNRRRSPSRNARRRRAHHVLDGWLRHRPGAVHPAADDRLLPARFTRRAGGLDARPRHGQLLQVLPRFVDGEPAGNLTRDNIVDDITLYWLTGTGASAARWYWEFGRAQAAAGAAGQASTVSRGSGRLHELPRRGLPCPAQLGRGGLHWPRLLQRARQGRPLRRLGGARALHDRPAGCVSLSATAKEG